MTNNIIGGIDGNHLRTIIERVERLEEEKKAITEDISEVFKEAKALGFDTKIMKQVIKIRKLDQNELYELETLIDVYKRALGMLPELDEEEGTTHATQTAEASSDESQENAA
jgi:uncharacterized protein (UPF0335 family)